MVPLRSLLALEEWGAGEWKNNVYVPTIYTLWQSAPAHKTYIHTYIILLLCIMHTLHAYTDVHTELGVGLH